MSVKDSWFNRLLKFRLERNLPEIDRESIVFNDKCPITGERINYSPNRTMDFNSARLQENTGEIVTNLGLEIDKRGFKK